MLLVEVKKEGKDFLFGVNESAQLQGLDDHVGKLIRLEYQGKTAISDDQDVKNFDVRLERRANAT